jgi:hypothetical protein
MSRIRKDPLRPLTEQERQLIEQLAHARGERADVVARARELLAVASGQTYTQAAATAKLLTLFCPRSGEVRARGVTHTTNAVLHPWLQQELAAVLDRLPPPLPVTNADQNHAVWESWQQGLQVRITLPPVLPALRLLLVWDNLRGTGHWH